MNLPEYFISCDWGTSNFRLRLVKTDTLSVIVEHTSNKGIKVLYSEYLNQKESNQAEYFSDYLFNQIRLLPIEHQNHLIVSAGMVTANIGLHELGYTIMPFKSDGSNLHSKKITLYNGLDVLLISGVRDDFGMMRGEETQAIGLSSLIESVYSDAILLLPGTHSKHLTFKNGKFLYLKSFMTGELFEIISQKSILSNSIIKADKAEVNEHTFVEGLMLGSAGKLTSSLFSIRARDLFKTSKKEDNYYFLSGLLIGDELSYLKNEKKAVFLASPYPLVNLYKIALKHILNSNNFKVFDSAASEKAILSGQLKILKLHEK